MVLNRLDGLVQAVSFNEFRYHPNVSHVAIGSPIGIDALNAKNLLNRLDEESFVRLPSRNYS